MCCSVLLCVSICNIVFTVLQCVAVRCSVLQYVAVCCSVLQCVAVCCSMLQCVAVCCSMLQCVAVCCGMASRQESRNIIFHATCVLFIFKAISACFYTDLYSYLRSSLCVLFPLKGILGCVLFIFYIHIRHSWCLVCSVPLSRQSLLCSYLGQSQCACGCSVL